MKKTGLYLIILAILAFGVWYFLIRDKGNPFGNSEAGFNISDTASIGKIFMADNSGRSVLLERTDTGWVVNKQYKVLPAPLQLLLYTLNQQKALYPVTEAAQNNTVKILAGNAIKVEVYDRKANKISVFYVGDEAYKFAGTIMLMEGAKKPFVVKIEDFSGYLKPRYSPNITDWRDRSIFNVKPEEIKTIAVQYPEHPINSFTLTQQNNKVTVTTDAAVMKSNAYNERRANVYLKFFQNINSEGYVNGADGLDSVIKIMPVKCIIDVTNTKGQNYHAVVHWMPINRRSKNILTPDRYTPDDYDPDRFYAIINNDKDTVMIQNHVFEKIFRNGFEFYQPDGAGDNKPQKHALTHPAEPAVKK